MGRVRRPDEVADAPLTYWRYEGRNVSAPIMAKPTMKLSSEATANTLPRNNLIGRIGSGTRFSTTTNRASATAEPANRPMIVAEPQGYSVPPQVVASVRPLAPRAISAAPQ